MQCLAETPAAAAFPANARDLRVADPEARAFKPPASSPSPQFLIACEIIRNRRNSNKTKEGGHF